MPCFICVTCGAQFPPATTPPGACPVCLDERQYVGHDGQEWTTAAELAKSHRSRAEQAEPGLVGVGVEPAFGIGQRALLVAPEGLLWDCVPLLGEASAQRVEEAGGMDTIAVSHPHFYSTMVDWAERFDARVLLHEADREWIMRPSPRVELWSGDRLPVSDSLTLVRLGGHFAGGTVCLWHAGAGGAGALLTGDIVQVVEDRDWVSFMRSYPNLIPLPEREVARMAEALAELAFERVYGGWWERTILTDARTKVLRSAERYINAVSEGDDRRS